VKVDSLVLFSFGCVLTVDFGVQEGHPTHRRCVHLSPKVLFQTKSRKK